MFASNCPKVSLQSCLSRESYDATFGMDECARNYYGVTLRCINQGGPFFWVVKPAQRRC